MGVNIMFDFTVDGLADEPQTKSVLGALTSLIRDQEGLAEHEVGMGWSVENGRYWISGETDYPIGISRFYAWRPHFEAAFQDRVHALAPTATTTINWQYPDDD